MEGGIGLGLLIVAALGVNALWLFVTLMDKLGVDLPYKPTCLKFMYIVIALMFTVGIGLTIGFALGITFKRMKWLITPWTFRKKALIILATFNIVPVCAIIYCRFTWCHNMEFAYLFFHNIYALLSIGLLAVYDRLKLRRLKSLDSR